MLAARCQVITLICMFQPVKLPAECAAIMFASSLLQIALKIKCDGLFTVYKKLIVEVGTCQYNRN